MICEENHNLTQNNSGIFIQFKSRIRMFSPYSALTPLI